MRWAVLLCLALSLLALFGLMLALSNLVWQPRVFVGLGGVVTCWSLLAWQLNVAVGWRYIVGSIVTVYLVTVLVQAWFFGALLGELQRHEAWLLRDISARVNTQYLQHGRDRLVIEGDWAWPPLVERSRQQDPLVRTLLPRCRVPDDQVAYRSYPLLAARALLQQFIREQVHGHQTA